MNSNKFKFLPNYLSILRIILTVFVIILMFFDEQKPYLYTINLTILNLGINNFSIYFFIAGIIFVIAAITDFLDGYLARKFNWVTDFGKIWDAISDKILTTSVFICLSVLGYIPFYFVLLMVFRDFVIDGYRMYAAKNGFVVAANIFGKAKATLQMVSICLIFFIFNYKGDYSSHIISYYLIQNLFVIFATFSSIVSGVIYVIRINKQINKLKVTKSLK